MTILVLTPTLFCQAPAPPYPHVVYAERDFRKLATNTVAPKYPEEATRLKITGLAVADVKVGANAAITSVTVVTAPCEAIRAEMKKALWQWRFEMAQDLNGQPLSFEGKITYYFVESAGEWKVFSSMDSFYVGPRFAQ